MRISIVMSDPSLNPAILLLTAEHRHVAEIVGDEEWIEPALIGREGVKEAIVLPEERAQPGQLAFRKPDLAGPEERLGALVVVAGASLDALHVHCDGEVEVEAVPRGRHPRERPPHSSFEGVDLRDRRA